MSVYLSLLLAIIALQACNQEQAPAFTPPARITAQPVTHPLAWITDSKINWDTIKPISISPEIKPLRWGKLPLSVYDSSGFRPLSQPLTQAKFDIEALPEKNFNLARLATIPINFQSRQLPPPKLIKAGMPSRKFENAALQQLGEAEGLQGADITCLFNDKDGFLWIATDNGLYRYDGENFLSYLPAPLEHKIFAIFQDHNGLLWLGEQQGGIILLDATRGLIGTSQRFKDLNLARMMPRGKTELWFTTVGNGVGVIDPDKQTIKMIGLADGLSDMETLGIAEDADRQIWITTLNKGVMIIDSHDQKIKYLTAKQGLKTDSLSSITADTRGRLWVSAYAGGGIQVFDPAGKKVTYTREVQGRALNTWEMKAGTSGTVWIGTSTDGVHILDIDKKKSKYFHTSTEMAGGPGDFVECISRDHRGQVWIGTRNGLVLIRQSLIEAGRIGRDTLTALLKDQNGQLWEGTLSSGIYILERINGTRRHLGFQQGLSGDSILALKQIGNTIYASTTKGLDLINPEKGTITHFGIKQHLGNKYICAICRDRTGKIWLGGYSEGVSLYDPATNTLKYSDLGYPGDNFVSILQDKTGDVWLTAIWRTLIKIDHVSGRVSRLADTRGIRDGLFKPLLLDNHNRLWMGTSLGVFLADPAKKTLTTISAGQGLIKGQVNSLVAHNGSFYAGMPAGFSVITPPEGRDTDPIWKVRSFGKGDGVSKKYLTDFQADLVMENGQYWRGGEGITVFDPLKSDFYAPRSFITQLFVMDKKLNIAGNWAPYRMAAELRLTYDQNFIRFNFAGLDLKKTDSTQYSYMLTGADKKWSAPASNSLSGSYVNLAAGNYTFKVVSRGYNGRWGPPAFLRLTIDPPWWKTWWAYLFAILIFIGGLWAFIRYRSLTLLREKRLLEQKVSIRTKEVELQKEKIEVQRDDLRTQKDAMAQTLEELKNTQMQLIQSAKMASLGELTAGIAHEIQNPLNFVNNFSEISQELMLELLEDIDRGDTAELEAISRDVVANLEKINLHGKRADGIVKSMLEHSRRGAASSQPTNLNALCDEFLKLAYQSFKNKYKDFSCEIDTHFDSEVPVIQIIQQDVGRVLLNLFNNAFYAMRTKGTLAGAAFIPRLDVSTITKGNWVEVAIKDNGTGVPDALKDKIMQPFFTTKPTGEGTGLGLSLSYDIITGGHRGKLWVESESDVGSTFYFMLPVGP